MMPDNIPELYLKARAALKEVEFWPQERTDEVCAAVGWELQKEETAKELAHLAVSESGIGVYEDKVLKVLKSPYIPPAPPRIPLGHYFRKIGCGVAGLWLVDFYFFFLGL